MRNKFLLIAVAITIIVSAILTVVWENYRAEKIQREQREQLAIDLDLLVESYKIGKVDVIDISTITPFNWEKLYLFGPYSTTERINKVTGLTSAEDIKTNISDDDGIVLFVFVSKNKVVQYMDYHRIPDFDSSDRESGYNRSEAIFVLDEKGRAIIKSPSADVSPLMQTVGAQAGLCGGKTIVKRWWVEQL